jgi:hypothetical protein
VSALEIGDARERDDEPARQFVNGLSVGISLSAVNFDFRAMGAEGGALDQVWRFTTTPTRFSSFHAKLGKAMDTYRSRFGEIPRFDPDDGVDDEVSGRG